MWQRCCASVVLVNVSVDSSVALARFGKRIVSHLVLAEVVHYCVQAMFEDTCAEMTVCFICGLIWQRFGGAHYLPSS
jgi:hypothetical protein